MEDAHLTKLGYQKALELLKNNIHSYGIAAAGNISTEAIAKNYSSLFSRDIGVSSLGILASTDTELTSALRKSLANLGNVQSERGQLPFSYNCVTAEIEWWMPGSIDSTLWWSIAVLEYYKVTKDEDFFILNKLKLDKAFNWLTYQDTNNDCLLEQGESSDWADEMPRTGTVLYTNCLWYWLVKLRIEVEGMSELSILKAKIFEAFNTLFKIHKTTDSNLNYLPDNEYIRNNSWAKSILETINSEVVYLPYYLSAVSHRSYEMRCDVYGNILACYLGLADKDQANSITQHIIRTGINKPFPIAVLYPPIYPGEADWRSYLTKGRQNYPHQYHNGGIWPYVGGFWVMWLAEYNQQLAKEELHNLALANRLNDWEFNEYLQSESGTPMGIPHQSWSMSMYLAAYKKLELKS